VNVMAKKMFSAEIQQLQKGKPEGPTETNGGGGDGISQEQYENLLEAIKSVREDVASGFSEKTSPIVDESVLADFRKEFAEATELKVELEELSKVILETRREISSIQSHERGPKIHAMTDQLDAVVGDTENATNNILEAVEIIEDKNESLELNATDPDELEITEAISKAVMKIYEACNFQDITGQRISKVVGTLKFVEDRIQNMIEILGGEDSMLAQGIVEQDVQVDGEVELSGPRAEGQEISQEEIDALFD
jgi:chemotaxis protein CheZ